MLRQLRAPSLWRPGAEEGLALECGSRDVPSLRTGQEHEERVELRRVRRAAMARRGARSRGTQNAVHGRGGFSSDAGWWEERRRRERWPSCDCTRSQLTQGEWRRLVRTRMRTRAMLLGESGAAYQRRRVTAPRRLQMR